MFNKDRGATATYRALARGGASGWVRAYRASRPAHHQRHQPDRPAGAPHGLQTPMSTSDHGHRHAR